MYLDFDIAFPSAIYEIKYRLNYHAVDEKVIALASKLVIKGICARPDITQCFLDNMDDV